MFQQSLTEKDVKGDLVSNYAKTKQNNSIEEG